MTNDVTEGPEHESSLAAPDAISMPGRSWLGPFARFQAHRTLPLPETDITLVNTSSAAVVLVAPSTDPLRKAMTGADADGGLGTAGGEGSLQPGGVAHLKLSGTAPVRPGRYVSALRVAFGAGGSLVVPIAVEVSTVVLWGIAFVLFGLAAAGLVSVLTTETALRAKQSEAIGARQAIHEQTERDRISGRQAGAVAEMDRDYAAALRALSGPPPMSFIDHRLSDAAQYLDAAATLRGDLVKSIAAHPVGEAEIEDLQAQWKAYGEIASDLAKLVPPVTATDPSP